MGLSGTIPDHLVDDTGMTKLKRPICSRTRRICSVPLERIKVRFDLLRRLFSLRFSCVKPDDDLPLLGRRRDKTKERKYRRRKRNPPSWV
ncbi:hypothetical protein NL676_032497 [Syzygium grande]|nr:hypothetical protein NL676_032497 [Syzygium grande]